jgi:hypothetical protein
MVVVSNDIPFSALEDLSALVVNGRSQDISAPMPDLEGDVVTLTLLPRSRWQTLLNLDVIQVSFYKVLSVSYTFTQPGQLAKKQAKRAPKGSREGTLFPAYTCRC